MAHMSLVYLRKTTPSPHWRTIAALTALVLAVHLALLTVPLRPESPGKPMSTGVLQTRLLALSAQDAATAPTRKSDAVSTPSPAAAPPSAKPVAEPAPDVATLPADQYAHSTAPTAQVAMPADAAPAHKAEHHHPPQAHEAVTADAAPDASKAAEQPPRSDTDNAHLSLAVHVPKSMQLIYDVLAKSRGFSLTVNGQLNWRHDGQHYEAQGEVSAPLLGSRRQSSVGEITASGLEPQRFGDKTRTERAAHFRRDLGVISFSNNSPDVALLPGAQDQLSVFMQLAARLGGDSALRATGQRIEVQTATARDAQVWRFSVVGPEQLDLPVGGMDSIKLMRVPQREYDTTVELWFAPALDWLPARIRVTQANGDQVDQRLRQHHP